MCEERAVLSLCAWKDAGPGAALRQACLTESLPAGARVLHPALVLGLGDLPVAVGVRVLEIVGQQREGRGLRLRDEALAASQCREVRCRARWLGRTRAAVHGDLALRGRHGR